MGGRGVQCKTFNKFCQSPTSVAVSHAGVGRAGVERGGRGRRGREGFGGRVGGREAAARMDMMSKGPYH